MDFLNNSSYEFRTPDQINSVLVKIFADFPEMHLNKLPLWELMSNAVEHGILDICFEAKTELLYIDKVDDEIEKRLKSGAYADRSAAIDVKEFDHEYVVVISDDGDGFDWRPFLDRDLSKVRDLHGRGILISQKTCKSIDYLGKGNKVSVVFDRLNSAK